MAALVTVGLSSTPGTPAKPSTSLAVLGGASTLPLAHLALDPTGSAGRRAPVRLPAGTVHLAGHGSPVTATGWAILASGRAAAQPRKPAPAARGGTGHRPRTRPTGRP